MVITMFMDKIGSRPKTSAPTERFSRSFVKAISWRALGTLDTILLAWLITGQLEYASMIGGAELLTKMFLYVGHERVWATINWGKND